MTNTGMAPHGVKKKALKIVQKHSRPLHQVLLFGIYSNYSTLIVTKMSIIKSREGIFDIISTKAI